MEYILLMADESTTGKRSRASENSPSNKEKKKSKSSHTVSCCICEADIVDDTDESVLCEGICQAWMHRKCAGISRQVFAVISKSNDPYLCSHCMLSNYKEEIVSLKNQVNSLSNELALLKGNQVPTDVSDSSLPDDSQVSISSADKHIKTMFNDYINEEKEKAKRCLNIIIHNIPESPSEDGNTRKKHDTDFVTDISHQHLNTKVSINKCFRIGKKGAKPRLLKISLGTELEKAIILHNRTKLRDPKLSPVLHKVFITPDLTPKERESNKNLRAQLKEMNKGSRQFQIKNGQIVERKK